MKTTVSGLVRDAGYEALFHLGGFLALAIHPTHRNLAQIERWLDESAGRRQQLRRLQAMGLVDSDAGREDWVPRLTKTGRIAFAGGRDPESCWFRSWDGRWRILSFDLPRAASRPRMVLRRWLQNKHFGRLQGSLWLSPDPVPALGEVLADDWFDPSAVVVFEGQPLGIEQPRDVSAAAWDFASINAAYAQYESFAVRQAAQLASKEPSPHRLRQVLADDRKRWWSAVRQDPLLPSVLHPSEYLGIAAWKARGKLLGKLGRAAGLDTPA